MNKGMMGLDGLYQLEKRRKLGVDEAGNDILSEPQIIVPWFGNLITDAGLDLLGSSTADNLAYCRLGTGTTAPAVTDTALEAQAGYSNSPGVGGASGVSEDGTYLYRRVSVRFAAGSVDGVELTEIGMAATGNGAANLFSRTLIKDEIGSPIPILLSPEEVLDGVYELRAYINLADVVVETVIDGAPATVTIRKHGALTNDAWLKFASVLGISPWRYFDASNRRTAYCVENAPAVASVPGWVGAGYLAPVRSYVPGSNELKLTLSVGLTSSNFATGIGALVFSTADIGGAALNGCWSWGFNPKLNKDNSRTASIVVGLTWGRYAIP